MKREKILQEAERLINGDRAAAYGDAYVNHKRIADMWSVIFGQEVTVKQVLLCMIALKTARLVHDSHEDSWVDICGYAGLGGEIDGKG
jgi:hypothetical protein|tara:strand:+ start:3846 stop:4109 length:264 start_codon:yes stop_codon:yes gene_type:complete